MSALDQAIIKAYAKDRPAATTAASDSRPRPAIVKTEAVVDNRSAAVEQLYRDGTLYRVEHGGAAVTATPRIVPRPHLASLPPTSPRRNVRRSVLRLLASEQAPVTVDEPTAPPSKVARKVIIRHVSHPAAPTPLGKLTSVAPTPIHSKAAPQPAPVARPARSAAAELPPEKIDEPLTQAPPPVAAPPATVAAPLNRSWEAIPPIKIHGHWLHEASIAPLVMVTDALAARLHPAFAESVIHVDGLAVAEAEAKLQAAQALAAESAAQAKRDEEAQQAAALLPSFRGKSFSDLDVPKTKIYIDAPHGASAPRAHVRFRVEEAVPHEDTAAPVDIVPMGAEVKLPSAAREGAVSGPGAEQAAVAGALAKTEEISAAATPAAATSVELPPASDLPAAEPLLPAELAETLAEPAEETRTAVPVWEIDRFQWPRTCEKLVADDSGYLSTAGDRLLAAVQDGLRVLAITGTRRGEGRTTMALCLARAAAKAGVEVAIMDADFARPQIASKLGLDTAHGWQDAALGRIPLSEAAIKSLADGITVLPLESSSVVRRLSLADPRVTATIRAVAATFELVILDLGPVQAGERLAFPGDEGSPLDAAIVVRDVRFATGAEGEAVGHMLQDLGVEAVGIAENFVIDEEIPATSV